MKMIVAIIRPEKLEAVQAALNARDVYLMTVTDVRGCGRQRGYTEVYRGSEFQIQLLSKLKLEIAVNEAFVEAAIEASEDLMRLLGGRGMGKHETAENHHVHAEVLTTGLNEGADATARSHRVFGADGPEPGSDQSKLKADKY